MSLRRIAHLDMDAFYASVELLRYPQLKGLPMVVGGSRRRLEEALAAQGVDTSRPDRIALEHFPRLRSYVGRGVITTASYAARAFGVGSAMGLMKAAKLCPDAVLLPADFDEYRRCSRAFKAVITDIAPVMEDRGIDEVYIDFTDVPGGQREGGRVLARLIQKSIADATALSCSIGVAPNKLLAKMGSELHKPAGITVLHSDDVQARIWPLAVRKINGVGPKAEAKLSALGIATIGELAATPLPMLLQHFGRAYGHWLHESAWGRDERPVVTHSEPVSISRETTFERDLHARADRAELGAILSNLCEQLARDLAAKGYRCRSVGIKLRFDDFQIATRDQTLPQPVSTAAQLRAACGQCLKRVDLSRRLRLLGVRAGKLERLGVPLPGLPSDGAATGPTPGVAADDATGRGLVAAAYSKASPGAPPVVQPPTTLDLFAPSPPGHG
jgi:DNA polymerase IV